MINIKKHIEKLGLKVEDKVTGVAGVITSVGFDLYGCVQAVVSPGLKADGTIADPLWFDIGRLRVISETPVMEQPNFDFGPIAEGKKGPAEKPRFYKH